METVAIFYWELIPHQMRIVNTFLSSIPFPPASWCLSSLSFLFRGNKLVFTNKLSYASSLLKIVNKIQLPRESRSVSWSCRTISPSSWSSIWAIHLGLLQAYTIYTPFFVDREEVLGCSAGQCCCIPEFGSCDIIGISSYLLWECSDLWHLNWYY